MGFLKDVKKTMDGPKHMQGVSLSMVHRANQPIDRGDPVWAPIEGITLDRYAEISAALARQNLTDADQIEAWVQTQGVQPDSWKAVQVGWVQRMAANMQVRSRYGVLYSQFSG